MGNTLSRPNWYYEKRSCNYMTLLPGSEKYLSRYEEMISF